MNRKDKIELINRLEIGTIPVEYFQSPIIKIDYVERSKFISTIGRKNDEDLNLIDSNLDNLTFGINPYTGVFYGTVRIIIVK